MRLTWNGDALIDPPTTFEEAVKVYKGLKDLAENSTKVVRFSLAPITDYCSDKDTILNAISTANVALVSSYLTYLFTFFLIIKRLPRHCIQY